MRKYLLMVAVVAAAAAFLLPTSGAGADGGTVITAGPGQYTLGFSHPTGTVSVGGGTTSARCTAASFVGNPTAATPTCTTKKIVCPTTASSCSLAVNLQENAARGPVAFAAAVQLSSGFSHLAVQEPYNCPASNNCGWRFSVTVPAGSSVQAAIANITKAGLVNVFAQTTLTAN